MRLVKMLQSVAPVFVFGAVMMGQTPADANRMGMDNAFITKAANAGMAEVELGKLAETNATDEKVKEFGKRMVTDHGKANDELRAIGSKKGVTWPTAMDSKAQATKDRLSKLNGVAFDRAYMQEMVKDHRQAVADFKKQANSGSDPDVKAFASKTLPTLEEHLKLAESTASQIKK